MLTPEEQKRIEEEEQYRALIRQRMAESPAVFCFACGKQLPDDAAFCASCGKAVPKAANRSDAPPSAPPVEPVPPSAPRVEPKRRGFPPGYLLFSVLVVIAIGIAVILSNVKSAPGPGSAPAPVLHREPVRRTVVNDMVSVTAGQSRWYTIQVPTLATLDGSFSASGGFGNDIQAAIMTAPELPNWVNGHVAQVFWQTPGPETVGSFNIRLAPGTYCIAFSNRQSIFSTKQLSVKADLIY